MSVKPSAIVMVITPFDEAGQVDEAKFRAQLGRLRSAGVSVFVAGSGTGEGNTLSEEERSRILTIAVEELKGKVQVRADGSESHSAKEMVRFVRFVEPFKLDAIRIMPLEIGHGATPTPNELEKYHDTVINATSSPIVLSSHEASGYVLPLDLVEKLIDRYPSIIGVNYGGKDVTYLGELIHRVADRVEVHCAGTLHGVTTLSMGGHGFMGGEGNLQPELNAAVIAAWQAKDYEKLKDSFGKLTRLARLIKRYGGFTNRGLKPLMNAFGLPGGSLREPRMPISQADLNEMIKSTLGLEIPGLSKLP